MRRVFSPNPFSRACASFLVAIIAAFARAPVPQTSTAAENSLAVINGGLSTSEDGPFVGLETHFSSGDYVYVRFEIAGFAVHSENRGETRKISLDFEVTPQDGAGRALAEPAKGEIETELSAEDKNWVPKRRVSFLLPSFLAAGKFRVHIVARDRFAHLEASRDYAFSVGGIALTPASSITVEHFQFLRREEDSDPLTVAAFSAGDTVFARFDLVGFENSPQNRHHVTYGVSVLGPDGKAFIQDPNAADLDDSSFYPAQFVPGTLALKMGKKNAPGQYQVVVKAHDLLANTETETRQPFSIE